LKEKEKTNILDPRMEMGHQEGANTSRHARHLQKNSKAWKYVSRLGSEKKKKQVSTESDRREFPVKGRVRVRTWWAKRGPDQGVCPLTEKKKKNYRNRVS